jgi:hypothetical protein
MKRIILIAGLVAVLIAIQAGCERKEKTAPPSSSKLPDASEMFDKKAMPPDRQGAGPK